MYPVFSARRSLSGYERLSLTGTSISKEIHAKRVKKTFLAKSRQTLRGGIVPEMKNIFFSKINLFKNFQDIRAHREKASLTRLKLETQAQLNMPRHPYSRKTVPRAQIRGYTVYIHTNYRRPPRRRRRRCVLSAPQQASRRGAAAALFFPPPGAMPPCPSVLRGGGLGSRAAYAASQLFTTLPFHGESLRPQPSAKGSEGCHAARSGFVCGGAGAALGAAQAQGLSSQRRLRRRGGGGSFGTLPRADNGGTGLIHSAASGGEGDACIYRETGVPPRRRRRRL